MRNWQKKIGGNRAQGSDVKKKKKPGIPIEKFRSYICSMIGHEESAINTRKHS